MPRTLTPHPRIVVSSHTQSARHYNSDLSIWLSVDPMSDKYPSLSPYAYCGNNPVRLVDPDGREIWVVGEDGKKYQYKNGALYDKGGIEVQVRKNSYEAKVLYCLNKLASSKDNRITGHLHDLENSQHTHTISSKSIFKKNFAVPTNDSDSRNQNKGSGSHINFNMDITFDYPDGADNYAPAALSHELLGHAWDYDKGKNTDERIENGIKLKEINAVNIQNIILRENGKKTRSQYGLVQKDNTIKWISIPTNLLDNYFTK